MHKGLSEKEAEKRLKEYGTNEIREVNKISLFQIFLRQIKNNFIIYLLLSAMIISFFVGEAITGYTIFVVICISIGTGFIQEYKAEKAIISLKQMLAPVSIVIRGGKEQEIFSKDIVPGDIIVLRSGEKIPADCVILEQRDVLVNESIITGESKEVTKKTAKSIKDAKEENMLFMGSFLIHGKCIAQVAHTGMNTKFGKIAGMISVTEKDLPLQKKVNKISKYISVIGIIMAIVTGFVVFIQTPSLSTENITWVLILVIAITVSSFPEGFPVVLITTLSVGVYKMAKKNAIVNRMSVIETLGETTVICSDKTGTITKGEMTVKEIYADNNSFTVTGVGYEVKGDFLSEGKIIDAKKDETLNLLLKDAVMCNDSIIERTGEDNIYRLGGLPTEGALLIMAAKSGYFKEDLKIDIENEIPFSSERKMMSVVVKDRSDKTVYSKGAFEVVIKKCNFMQRKDGVFRLTEKEKDRLLEVHKQMTTKALRVVALAYKKGKNFDEKEIEENLIFLGMVGMEDPPREEIKEALSLCRQAGIKVKMITGDNRETALAVAQEINLGKGEIIDGEQLDKMDDSELHAKIGQIIVFARVRPEHKLRIIKALKENGEVITMTGDGVNDAPALKEAHIGVAMGRNGTDVSRSVADMVLKDDNFATIVDAIKEGRTIFNNARKFVTYQLSCNFAEMIILFFGVLLVPVFGWPLPILLALQILFMNLVTDDIPAITLGFNPSSTDIMEERPRKNSELLNKRLIVSLMFAGALMALIVLTVFYINYNVLGEDATHSRTAGLVTLIALEIAGAYNFRSFRKGVLNRSPLVNKYLFYASLISIAATLLIIYTPLNTVFGTSPMTSLEWIISIIAALVFIIVFDVLKRINERKHFWSEEENHD
jgi:Ca2+-transporting ATPase